MAATGTGFAETHRQERAKAQNFGGSANRER